MFLFEMKWNIKTTFFLLIAIVNFYKCENNFDNINKKNNVTANSTKSEINHKINISEIKSKSSTQRRSDGSQLFDKKTSINIDEISLFKRGDTINNFLGIMNKKNSSDTNLNKNPFIFDSKLTSDEMTLIKPAEAELSYAPFNETKKRKKNFSKLAKTLLIASRMFDKKSIPPVAINSNDTIIKAARSFTSTRNPLQTHLRIFEMGGFCSSKLDGLYDDPDDCENFIICFADRTFRTKCSFGTKWNHIIKECDFPEKVDCDRNLLTKSTANTTQTTLPASKSKGSTVMILPKFSNITIPNPNVKFNYNLARQIKTNMLLIVITIPAGLLLLVIIAATVIYWHNKFKSRRQKEIARNIGVNGGSTLNTNISLHSNKTRCKKQSGLIKRLSLCCCYRKFSDFGGCQKNFRTANIISSCANARGDHIRSQINSSILNNNSKNNKNNSSSIAYQKTHNQTSSEDLDGSSSSDAGITTTINDNNSNTDTIMGHDIDNKNKNKTEEQIINQIIAQTTNITNNNNKVSKVHVVKSNECHIATGSHVTLSSHFEENNWDYNFATRGLYLSQPWVRGRYDHTLGSESLAPSTVLTLDPVVTEVANATEKHPKKMTELYNNNNTNNTKNEQNEYSESDGYYA